MNTYGLVPGQNTGIETGTGFLFTKKSLSLDLSLKVELRSMHAWGSSFHIKSFFSQKRPQQLKTPFFYWFKSLKLMTSLLPHSFSWLTIGWSEIDLSVHNLFAQHPSSMEPPLLVKLLLKKVSVLWGLLPKLITVTELPTPILIILASFCFEITILIPAIVLNGRRAFWKGLVYTRVFFK